MTNKNIDINKIASLWEEITGIAIDSEVIRLDTRSCNIYDINRTIQKYINNDKDNGLSVSLYIKYCFLDYIENTTYPLKSFITGEQDNEITNYLSKCKEMYTILNCESLIEYEHEMYDTFSSFITANGGDAEQVKNVPAHNMMIYMLNARKTARSIKSDVFRLMTGSHIDNLALNNNILEFSNSSQILIAAESLNFEGISLCAITDNEYPERSYFAFLIKSNEGLYLISDAPEEPHPNYKNMSRCPGRTMYDRIDKAYFPYELLNLRISKYNVRKEDNEIATADNCRVIGNIRNLSVEEQIWIYSACMEIVEMLKENSINTNDISLTGDMVIPKCITANINALSIKNKQFDLHYEEIYTKENVKKFDIKYNHESSHANDWLVEKFADNIDERFLNGYNGEFVSIEDKSASANNSIFDDKFIEKSILKPDMNLIGTLDQIQYNRKWVARYNYASMINRLAEEDWNKNYCLYEEWYENLIEKNKEHIFELIAKADPHDESVFCYFTNYNNMPWYFHNTHHHIYKGEFWKNPLCCINEARATLMVGIHIASFEDFKKIFVIQDEDIPDYFYHYFDKPYNYNCILDNGDPFDWVIKNPAANSYGRTFCFDITVWFSKSGYNGLRKKYGQQPNKFWTEI